MYFVSNQATPDLHPVVLMGAPLLQMGLTCKLDILLDVYLAWKIKRGKWSFVDHLLCLTNLSASKMKNGSFALNM